MATILKRTLAVAAAASLAVSLAACGGGGDNSGSASSSGGKGGTVYYHVSSLVESTDPQRIYIGRDITNFSRLVYRSLVTFPSNSTDPDTAQKPVADLATDTGTSSEGGKVWKFTLKDGIKWQDGSDITCADFQYGASRAFAVDTLTGGPNYILAYLNLPAPTGDAVSSYSGPYTKQGQADFDKAITCDGKTITYNFKTPWPDFPLAVAALHMMDPYKKSQDQGAKSKYAIFSNGPYKLQGTWNQNNGGTFVRNSEYDAKTDSTDIRKALPDKFVFDIGKTEEVIADQLIADGGNDKFAVTDGVVPPPYYSRITGAVADRVQNVQSPYVDYLVPNFTTQPNVKVREAMYTAFSVKSWIEAGGGSRAFTQAKSIVTPSVTGYKENPSFTAPATGDAAAAKKLLQEAGVTTPYPIKFSYRQKDSRDKQAAALKASLDEAGFNVTLDPIESTAYYDTIRKVDNKSDLMWAGWGADWPSAITITPPLFDSSINLSADTRGQDYGAYKSTAFNDLVKQAQSAADLNAQTEALQAADAQLGKDFAYLPLVVEKFVMNHGSKVKTIYGPASNGYPDLGPISVQN